MFEFDVDEIRVSSNEGMLILLGNDILDENPCFKYLGCDKNKN
jgi:hypothetical protein